MIKGQKGFIYPIALSIYLLVISFFLVITGIFINEKKTYKDSKLLLTQEYYFMSSIKELEGELQSGKYNLSGEYRYRKGEVTYSIERISDILSKVEYRLYTDQEAPIIAYSYFDMEENRMTKWVEAK